MAGVNGLPEVEVQPFRPGQQIAAGRQRRDDVLGEAIGLQGGADQIAQRRGHDLAANEKLEWGSERTWSKDPASELLTSSCLPKA